MDKKFREETSMEEENEGERERETDRQRKKVAWKVEVRKREKLNFEVCLTRLSFHQSYHKCYTCFYL